LGIDFFGEGTHLESKIARVVIQRHILRRLPRPLRFHGRSQGRDAHTGRAFFHNAEPPGSPVGEPVRTSYLSILCINMSIFENP
jgi:hypothetical protein